jgi:YjbE family integral membrane protein
METLGGETLARFLGVLVVNLLLSGDNAVVIALAVRELEGNVRRRAVFWGATGAVALRLVFAAVVTFLLRVPLLQAAGGVLLVWIAWRLVEDAPGDEAGVEAGGAMWQAVRIIIVADVVMSLDNVIALVGVSGGDLWLLAVGLALTVPLVIWGSTLLSAVMTRFRWLVYAGAGLLVYVAAEMVLDDRIVEEVLGGSMRGAKTVVELLCAAVFVAYFSRRDRRAKRPTKD